LNPYLDGMVSRLSNPRKNLIRVNCTRDYCNLVK
jgi:hypothetical protein